MQDSSSDFKTNHRMNTIKLYTILPEVTKATVPILKQDLTSLKVADQIIENNSQATTYQTTQLRI
jgi:hypothetical protein